ncbi:hypothetical protein M378DRAFT_165077 [Amanita muscaria Koide BX008]|uniref:Uncharacterized protein n=1 Tax=Amanita muscaria (strain Koide BX008) TaxID=946122 RepID=A0A0C2SIJ1_AMAMK|nr:hypothetical protein M378DRAFT_165077 [Amanita muscaria Koide BX008]
MGTGVATGDRRPRTRRPFLAPTDRLHSRSKKLECSGLTRNLARVPSTLAPRPMEVPPDLNPDLEIGPFPVYIHFAMISLRSYC